MRTFTTAALGLLISAFLFAGTTTTRTTTEDGHRTQLRLVRDGDGHRTFATWERDGIRYITHDANVMAALDEALEAQRVITRDHTELARRQAELGRQHAELGREHAELGRRYAEVGRAAASGNRADLDARRRELDAAMAALDRKRRDLDREQRELGSAPHRDGHSVDDAVDAIFARALREGKAARD
jgi:chromosome segregation ATPase